MTTETQNDNAASNPFGSKKVTQAEVAMFMQQALRPLFYQLKVTQNGLETLLMYLAEVGIDGRKITSEEIVAFVKSKNNDTAGAEKANGTQA